MVHLIYTLIFLCAVYVDIESAVLNRKYDVIVIGLGASGTTAASILARAGRQVLGLEAQNRTGGRVYTMPCAGGLVELGAEWIHGTEVSFTYNIARNASVDILVQDDVTLGFFSNGSLFDEELLDNMMKQLEQPDYELDPEPIGKFITARVKKYLEENYPHVLDDADYTNEILDFLNRAVGGIEGTNDWNDASTATKYQKLPGSQDASWHKFGYKTFFDILLDTYNNGTGIPNLKIKLNSEVTRISYLEEAPTSGLVRVTTIDGVTYDADTVIVTVSLGVLQERHKNLFHPSLPERKITAIEKMSIGTVDKIILIFEEPWWPKNVSSSLFVWRGEERRKIKEDDKWLLKVFGGSLSMGSDKAFVYWLHGDAAKQMESLTDEVVQNKIMEITRMFMGKNRTIPDPISIIRTSWYSNPYTRGSYTYDNNMVTQYPDARKTLGEPIYDANGRSKILFAGEATNVEHYSTVHGAAESGIREAVRLLGEKYKMPH